jgi:hypothetical protein
LTHSKAAATDSTLPKMNASPNSFALLATNSDEDGAVDSDFESPIPYNPIVERLKLVDEKDGRVFKAVPKPNVGVSSNKKNKNSRGSPSN